MDDLGIIVLLYQKVEDNSKTLRTSLSGVEAAHLGIEAAKSKKLPDLDASLSFSYIGNALITDRDFSNVHGLKSPHFGNNFAFQAQQVVFAGGAINAGIKLAELGKQQAEVGVKLTRQQIRFIALGQYLDLYKIDNRIKDADGVTALLQEWGVQSSCRLPVSLALLAVGLVGDSGIGDNLNLLACLVHLASFILLVSLVHS